MMDWTWEVHTELGKVALTATENIAAPDRTNTIRTHHFRMDVQEAAELAHELMGAVIAFLGCRHKTEPEPKQIEHMALRAPGPPGPVQREEWWVEANAIIMAGKIHELVNAVNELRKAE